MNPTAPITIGGAFSSPYSMKMRAVLRYRRIPFRWVLRGSQWDDLPEVPVKIIPVLAFPDDDGNHGETMVDSSPQIARLEQDFTGRSLVGQRVTGVALFVGKEALSPDRLASGVEIPYRPEVGEEVVSIRLRHR